jgi:hypothetical protein
MVGGAKQRRANKAAKQQAAQATAQQQQQEEAQAKAMYQQGIDTFKRALSACMDARGYSIKCCRSSESVVFELQPEK